MAKGVTIDLIVDPKGAIRGINEVEKKASSASDALGKLGGVAGAALAGLGVAAAAGAAALGAAVVRAYADYEQLAGGVKKLFGDASATVSEFAANAANTAGLSVNQYLATVTSFSASLISGLGGDQEAAAAMADVAITDMADNANTFGTSIEMIQNAYQGFAKDNFTMLDNLKLGFGGSAGGMADLINQSGVLGDTMVVTAENVRDVPFDQMIAAIHEMQTRMGIAGTTAREASETISGSFNSTKASLQNLVLGFGSADADFEKLVGDVAANAQNLVNNVAPVFERLGDAIPLVAPVLISAIEKLLPTLLPLAANVVSSLLEGIVGAAPKLIQGAIPVVISFAAGILKMLPAILDAGLKVLVALIQGISKALPQLIPAAVKAVVGLVSTLVENLPLLIDAGIQMILALGLGLIEALPRIIEKIPTLISGIITALVEAIPQLVMAGVQLFVALVSNLPAILDGLVGAAPIIIDALVKAFTDPKFWKQMGDAGVQLIKGLWEGIKGTADWLWKQMSGFFGDVIDNIKGLFGIHSPSTVFAGFGKYMILGLEKGLTGPNQLGSIMSGLSNQVQQGFDGSLSVRARAAVSGASAGGGVSSGYLPTPAPQVSQTIYMLPEQDPRIVGRQFGREFARMMAGTP